MNWHPGGEEHTRQMLIWAGLRQEPVFWTWEPVGEAVCLMREQGYTAEGIDLCPGSDTVRRGDFLQTSFPAGSFDGVLSQCAFLFPATRQARCGKPGVFSVREAC